METVAQLSIADITAVLTRTPGSLKALLLGLPEIRVRRNEGEGTWSAFDIVGHLVFLERTQWLQRVRFVLENGAARPFGPVDRFAHLKENQGTSLAELLDEFDRLRTNNLAGLRELNLQCEDLARPATHPALGSVTLSELLATWAVHDLNHLHQLARVLAYQYRDAVGPWKAYMGVLHCSGHSAP